MIGVGDNMKISKILSVTVAVFLISLFSACSGFLNNMNGYDGNLTGGSKARVISVTSDSNSGSSSPNWNVFFPPALNEDFYVIKGIPFGEKINIDSSSTSYERFNGCDSSYKSSYVMSSDMSSWYAGPSDSVYLDPDSTDGMAYVLLGSSGKSSSLIYPSDMLTVHCNYFTRSNSSSGITFSWDFDYGTTKPDALYLVVWSSNNKTVWGLEDYYSENETDFSLFQKLSPYDRGYTWSSGYIWGSDYAQVYAAYGKYFVRVTGYY